MTPARRRPPPDVREVHRRLKREHGPLDPPPVRPPTDELVLTILSQNTSDTNRDRAYASLRERFPTWEDVAGAREGDVVEAIRPGGLANTKAPRIMAVLRAIRERDGDLDLRWLADATDAEVRDYLVTLPGVGPKTAACVLAFSLGRRAIPVDTHVGRVAERLGWLPPRAAVGRAHEELERLVPAQLRLPMHVALIRHGRAICKAGRPRCEACVLGGICPTAPVYLGTPP